MSATSWTPSRIAIARPHWVRTCAWERAGAPAGALETLPTRVAAQYVPLAPRPDRGPVRLDPRLPELGRGGVEIGDLELDVEGTLLVGEESEPGGGELKQRDPPGHMAHD